MPGFSGGTIKSSMPQETPAQVAFSNPNDFTLSKKVSVFSFPCFLKISLVIVSKSFIFISEFWKGSSSGIASLKIILPTLVSVNFFSLGSITFILAFNSMSPLS